MGTSDPHPDLRVVFCSFPDYERLAAEVSFRDKFLFVLHRETGRTAVRLFDTGAVQDACIGDIDASAYVQIVQGAIALDDERMGPELKEPNRR